MGLVGVAGALTERAGPSHAAEVGWLPGGLDGRWSGRRVCEGLSLGVAEVGRLLVKG